MPPVPRMLHTRLRFKAAAHEKWHMTSMLNFILITDCFIFIFKSTGTAPERKGQGHGMLGSAEVTFSRALRALSCLRDCPNTIYDAKMICRQEAGLMPLHDERWPKRYIDRPMRLRRGARHYGDARFSLAGQDINRRLSNCTPPAAGGATTVVAESAILALISLMPFQDSRDFYWYATI